MSSAVPKAPFASWWHHFPMGTGCATRWLEGVCFSGWMISFRDLGASDVGSWELSSMVEIPLFSPEGDLPFVLTELAAWMKAYARDGFAWQLTVAIVNAFLGDRQFSVSSGSSSLFEAEHASESISFAVEFSLVYLVWSFPIAQSFTTQLAVHAA